ncbi:hypothetical protein D3C75_1365650 [compost metagenome]
MLTHIAVSEAKSFAIEAACVWFWPWSLSEAARYIKRRAASMSVAISAIEKATAWFADRGLPNCLRSWV